MACATSLAVALRCVYNAWHACQPLLCHFKFHLLQNFSSIHLYIYICDFMSERRREKTTKMSAAAAPATATHSLVLFTNTETHPSSYCFRESTIVSSVVRWRMPLYHVDGRRVPSSSCFHTFAWVHSCHGRERSDAWAHSVASVHALNEQVNTHYTQLPGPIYFHHTHRTLHICTPRHRAFMWKACVSIACPSMLISVVRVHHSPSHERREDGGVHAYKTPNHT